jgi:hypothetical protein
MTLPDQVPTPTPPEAILKMAEPDYIGPKKNLYSVGYRELVWRNFLAGISRGIGGVIVSFIFFVVIMGFVAQLLMPLLGGLFESFTQSTSAGGQNQLIPSYEQLFGIATPQE